MFIMRQSASSSSATICAMADDTCWPISALPTITVILPSGAIEYHGGGLELAGGQRVADALHARNRDIAEGEARGAGADQEIPPLRSDGKPMRSMLVMAQAPDLARISAAARTIARWIRP